MWDAVSETRLHSFDSRLNLLYGFTETVAWGHPVDVPLLAAVTLGPGRGVELRDDAGGISCALETTDVSALCWFSGPGGVPTLATGSSDSAIRLWDAAGAPTAVLFGGPDDEARSMRVTASPQGRLLMAVGYGTGVVAIWDVAGTGLLRTIDTDHDQT